MFSKIEVDLTMFNGHEKNNVLIQSRTDVLYRNCQDESSKYGKLLRAWSCRKCLKI